MPNSKTLADLSSAITARGLDPAAVGRHAELLTRCLREQKKPQFKILDTCRRDNGGILPRLKSGATTAGCGQHVVGFVPAAGAASRYSRPLAALTDALEAGDLAALQAGLVDLGNEGAAAWPLPPRVQALIAAPQRARDLDKSEQAALLADLQLPKALLPCVAEGLTFLTLKHREHLRLAERCGLAGQVYVVPPGYERTFASELAKQSQTSTLATHYVPQGPALSTLRFNPDGTPYMEDRGDVSPVPAGHGTLTQLFADVRRSMPGAKSLLVRNIDNVVGTSEAAMDATQELMALHALILDAVASIRQAFAARERDTAAKTARMLFGRFETVLPPPPQLPGHLDADTKSLWALQACLFHTNLAALTLDDATLTRLYARPVNVLGQVPNTGKDVGGTPCFVETPNGTEKVCLEVPHASVDDRKAFLENVRRATHFNPVYVMAEIVDAEAYAQGADQFWILAEKTYRGRPVVYYETVLYELLGNSRLANSVFVEIPRLLFNPHKTLSDAAARRASSWLGADATKR